jgi:hypothetical protein
VSTSSKELAVYPDAFARAFALAELAIGHASLANPHHCRSWTSHDIAEGSPIRASTEIVEVNLTRQKRAASAAFDALRQV